MYRPVRSVSQVGTLISSGYIDAITITALFYFTTIKCGPDVDHFMYDNLFKHLKWYDDNILNEF